MTARPIIRRFVPTRRGSIHVAECGEGDPVLLLHQTPRSWDEYRGVLPLLGDRVRAIAIDTPGFGDSVPHAGAPTIEGWAAAAYSVLDALGVGRACLVGHHTGAVIAMEMAASHPARAAALVLSSCPMVDAARRAGHAGRRVIDAVEPRADGSHLAELWERRAPFYPAGDVSLLERFMVDALKAGPMAAAGHHVVNVYRMEDRIAHVACPTLVIDAAADPHAHPHAAAVAAAIPGARLHAIVDGMVPLPDQKPEAFSAAILDFLDAVQCRYPKGTPPWTPT